MYDVLLKIHPDSQGLTAVFRISAHPGFFSPFIAPAQTLDSATSLESEKFEISPKPPAQGKCVRGGLFLKVQSTIRLPFLLLASQGPPPLRLCPQWGRAGCRGGRTWVGVAVESRGWVWPRTQPQARRHTRASPLSRLSSGQLSPPPLYLVFSTTRLQTKIP